MEFKCVKPQDGIYGEEIADRFVNITTQNYHVTYSRTPKSAIVKSNRKENIKKMAKTTGGNNKRRDY